MAPRSRRSAAAAAEAAAKEEERAVAQEEEAEEEHEQEQEQEQEHNGLRPLRFKQPLVGRPGKPISVGDLLARLETLLNELRTIDQEEAHHESLRPVANELVTPGLLQHKDVGVRAWTCCCLVDMLKLFAPDAPYPAKNLKVCAAPCRRHARQLLIHSPGNLHHHHLQAAAPPRRPLAPV